MNRALWLWGILFAVWLLLSGHIETLFIVFGLFTCTVAVWVSVRMGIVDRESVPVHLLGRAIAYVPWLVWEVFKSNVRVARIILSPRIRVDPSIVHFRASQTTDLGRFIYANSITLTPGTVSVETDEGTIDVHAMTREAAEDVRSGDMDRRVTDMEGES